MKWPRVVSVLSIIVSFSGFPPVVLPGIEVDYKYNQSGGLPEYCDPKLKQDRKAFWRKKLGKDPHATNVSHFCIGLRALYDIKTHGYAHVKNKSARTARIKRSAKKAIRQLTYYGSRLPKDHWIKPDVHKAFAEAYEVLGNRKMVSKHRALAAGAGGDGGKSTGALEYMSMSDRMMQVGRPDEAVELLELALKLDPTSREIKRKLNKARSAAAAKAADGPAKSAAGN